MRKINKTNKLNDLPRGMERCLTCGFLIFEDAQCPRCERAEQELLLAPKKLSAARWSVSFLLRWSGVGLFLLGVVLQSYWLMGSGGALAFAGGISLLMNSCFASRSKRNR